MSSNHATPQNVIWITTDHMRYDCVGAHGNSAMHTPNLDRLVNGGISFDRCYANNPVCMPSRASFMTGCYPQQTGVVNNGLELDGNFPSTVARVLKTGGYQARQIGKLHFQNHEDHDLDPRARHAYGFDSFELSEEPGCYEDAYRTWLRGAHPDLVETFTLARPKSFERRAERTEYRVLDAPWTASHSGWIAQQFENKYASWGLRRGRQFYHLGFYAPHPPLNPTREMFAPYADIELPPLARRPGDPRDPRDLDDNTLLSYRRHFYAMVTGVDMAVGRILEALENTGELENTLVIFGSDHGDALGDHGRTGKGPSFLESIIRMPLVLHWPAGFGTTARRVAGMVEMVDIMPTLAELCGIPRHRYFAGRSYAQELLSGAPVEGRSDVYAFHGEGSLMLRTEMRKYLCYYEDGGRREELYDLEADPDEFQNIATDAARSAELQRLRDRAFERTLEATKTLKERTHQF